MPFIRQNILEVPDIRQPEARSENDGSSLTIAIDYDKTFTSDADFWTDFIKRAQSVGHSVVCVTARDGTDDNRAELQKALPQSVPIVFSNLKPKRDAAEQAGHKIDVWIDDKPENVDAPLARSVGDPAARSADADSDATRDWVTLESGVHVDIGAGGKIEKGPASMKGKAVAELKEEGKAEEGSGEAAAQAQEERDQDEASAAEARHTIGHKDSAAIEAHFAAEASGKREDHLKARDAHQAASQSYEKGSRNPLFDKKEHTGYKVMAERHAERAKYHEEKANASAKERSLAADGDTGRTVWVAGGTTLPPREEPLPPNALSMPYQRTHVARVFDSRAVERVVGEVQIEDGVQEFRVYRKGDTEATVSEYRFDADKFTQERAQAWLSTHLVKLSTFELAAGPGGTSQFQRSEGAAMPMKNMHAARILEPSEYKEIVGQKEIAPGVNALFAKKEGNEGTETASYHFDSDKFTPEKAKEWLKENKVEKYNFEAAKPDKKRQDDEEDDEEEESDEDDDSTNSQSQKRSEPNVNHDRVRTILLRPETCNESERSVEAVVATDSPILSTELRTGKAIHEVWRMDGMECDDQVPLLDTHNARSVRSVIGSLRNCRATDHEAVGRLFISEAEPNIWTKIREGHIKDVSGRASPVESTTIPAGRSALVRDATYTSRKDQPLTVHTRWRLREVSLTPLGADPKAKIRSLSKEFSMNAKLRKYLETIGLKADSTDQQATEFYTSLPESTRGLADAEATKADPPPPESKPDSDKIRADADKLREEGAKAERDRQAKIQELAKEVAPDLVRTAIDEGWTIQKVEDSVKLLQKFRDRTRSVAPYGQSRSVENDLTADVLAAAATIRCLNNAESGTPGRSYASDPVNLLRRYHPSQTLRSAVGDWIPDFPTQELSEEHKKLNHQILNQADRYRHLSNADLCRHCLRLGGQPVDGLATAPEVVGAVIQDTMRAGPSGGAFGAIFTNVFNALFLAGYLEAEDTTMGWVTEGDAANFMPGELATVGKMGHLTLSGKGKADEMTYGDWNERIKVDRFSGMYEVDETDLINDRFGVVQTNSPQELGLSARRLRPNLVYSILLNNYTAGTGRGPTLNQNGRQLFCALNSNFLVAASNDLYTPATGAVGVAGLQLALPAIKKQRLNGIPLNLTPRFIIVPPDLDIGIRIALFSTQRIMAAGSGGTLNPLQAFNLEMRSDARMDEVGSVDPLNKNAAVVGLHYHYLLICRPGEEGAKTMHVNYLAGSGRAPQIRSYVLGGPGAPGRWGIGWDVKLDIGAAVADFRAMYYVESTT